MNQDLAGYWEERKSLVQRAIGELLEPADGPSGRLREAMEYSLNAGGKRLRPVLAMASYEVAGGKNLEEVMPVAVALEFIHTFSLIHDDLPAIDNDDLRRGVPTSHRVFGEAMAVLAGDALLVDAYRLMTDGPAPEEVKLAVIAEITRAIGTKGVIAGEVVDVLAEKEAWQATPDLVRYIHEHKTGTLISAAMAAGALVARAGADTVKFLRKQGARMGLLFQVTDDLLDVIGDQSRVGKDLGKDTNKATWVKVRGIEGAREDATRMAAEITGALRERFGESGWALCAIVSFIAEREY